ncbi:MAG TPA: VTT domain-containing protein [Terracidiphilus sp.]|nr:VTT domain-containing protein [Terracidiphilus sp.]
MKLLFLRVMAWWKVIVLPAIASLGLWGVGLVAILDSSSIPVPMDAVLAVFVWNNKSHFLFCCILASLGSSIGGLLPYGLGRAGGELFLLKRINRARFDTLRLRFERQEFLAVMIPSMLPPPAPWKLFVFGAGVFEMRVLPFMLAVFTGRMVRWLILSVLVLELGPGAADLVAHHALWVVAVIGVLALGGFAWWWIRKKRKGDPLEG